LFVFVFEIIKVSLTLRSKVLIKTVHKRVFGEPTMVILWHSLQRFSDMNPSTNSIL